jgi:hypothetical protein
MTNLLTVITPEFVQKWFSNYTYGAPTNVAEIAPALDAEYKRLLYVDHTPVQYSMSLGESLNYYELFSNYLNGKISGAPSPVFTVFMVYSTDDSSMPKFGETINGNDAVDLLWYVVKSDRAKEICESGNAIATFTLTFASERDVDSYRLTRNADYTD